MRNFSVSVRAGVSFMLITCLLIALGGISLWKMQELRANLNELRTDAMASISVANKISTATLRLRLNVRRFIGLDAKTKELAVAQLKASRDVMLKQVASYAPFAPTDEAGRQERESYQTVDSSANKFSSQVDAVIELGRTSTIDAVTAYVDTNIAPVAQVLQDATDVLIKINEDQADEVGESSEKSYQAGVLFIWLIIIASVLATVVLAVLLTRSIVRPLNELLVLNNKIASGDLSGEVGFSGKDEISALQKSTSNMQKNLRQTISLISSSSTQLASAAEQMSSITAQSSEGLGRQNQEIEQAATAVNEMTAAVDEVARNAAAASTAAKASNASTVRGTHRVSSTVNAIEKLSATVLATSVDVQRLAGQSQDISKVLAVIRKIAEQTNLLALNAAIEAARAGEQGRGFAVVADEVRALAHRTQQSTQEIEQMIDAILNGSELATRSMQDSCDGAKDTLNVAHEAGAALTEIAQSIREITEMNTLIATAAEQQAQVARAIDHNLVSIRDLSALSTEGAGQTSVASNELSRLAAEMNAVVIRFKM
ncbi:methyl-accepting chemotaxis protein [Pseudomonas sp. MWU16-30317]|uniref:methyl-accepting chemotaxis protein n=1 Tax=Pseudomonas sp. MWU16-30317 TaxID=2878095 RepID=UPI001CFC3825|nr:methyl-accepting chemotaxis protein [Pseudomonas sp. MWU16-30317]